MTQSKTSARRVIGAEKRARVLELRKLGFTLAEIGAQLGKISAQRVHKILMEELERLAMLTLGNADALRRLELERLEIASIPVVAKLKKGDLKAAAVWIRLSESRRKLLGLDAPIKVAPTDPNGNPLKHDLSKLSTEELGALAALVTKSMEGPQG